MTDESTVAKITALKQEQDRLTAQVREERLDTLATLAGQCALLGPLTRGEFPGGILRTRERKAAKVAKVRKAKAAAEEK